MAVCMRWCLLLLMCFFSSVTLNGSNDGKNTPYYIPIPDEQPLALRAHRNLAGLAEPVLLRPLRTTTKKGNCYGIDVSRYQGRINWSQVSKDKRVSYVYLKATEGVKLVDPTYKYNHRAVGFGRNKALELIFSLPQPRLIISCQTSRRMSTLVRRISFL